MARVEVVFSLVGVDDGDILGQRGVQRLDRA